MTINDQLLTLIKPHAGLSLFADVSINQHNGESRVQWRGIECTCSMEYCAEEDAYLRTTTQRNAYGDTPELAIAACLAAEVTTETKLI